MLIRNKRAWIADRLCDLGVVRLLERYGRRPGLVTLVYHRLGEPATDPFYRPMIVAPEVFEHQLRRLRDAFRIIGLEELAARVDETGRLDLNEPAALITFDDGYRDNATLAGPILASLGLPAALFVTTGFVGQPAVLSWWDRVAYAVQASPRATIALDRPLAATLALNGDRTQAVHQVIAALIAAGWRAKEADLVHLEERAGIDPEERSAAAARLFLSASELTALTRSGFTIGAHTHTHCRLGGLPATDQIEELNKPRALLETWLGRPVRTVAYPYGGAGSIDSITRQSVREAGYTLAFALDPRPLRPGPIDRWALPRFSVSPADSSNLLRARLALAATLSRSRL